MIDTYNDRRPRLCGALHLTERQQPILALIADCKNTAAIAGSLGISRNTVKSHISAMMALAGVHSRFALVDVAKSQGLLDMTVSPPQWTGCGCPLGKHAARPRLSRARQQELTTDTGG